MAITVKVEDLHPEAGARARAHQKRLAARAKARRAAAEQRRAASWRVAFAHYSAQYA